MTDDQTLADYLNPRKPRIVPPPDDAAEEEYKYFALNTGERLTMIKEQIENREKGLWNLELLAISLEGNEAGAEEHKDNFPGCQCARCELPRVRASQRAVQYGIQKLRALYARMS